MSNNSALTTHIQEIEAPSSITLKEYNKKQQILAFQDILQGIRKWRVWSLIAYQDVKLRYRRSVLGPFWITLSMAITCYSMGYLYSHLFHTDLQSYFPFLVAGMLSWALISSQINDLTEALIFSDGLIKQIKLPYSLYIHRVVTRNMIIFFHNILVLIPIIAIFHEVAKVNLNTLLIIPNIIILYLNAFTYGLALSLIGARYRDLTQIIKSLIQVAFFLTPVMWNPAILPPKDQFLINFNPFYAFIELIRGPLLGYVPSLSNFIMTIVVTIIGIIFSFCMFAKYRARIVYWL